MKAFYLLFLSLICLSLLAGCSGQVFDRAYTASGEGSREQDLKPDEQFSPSEDLNVVIKLNQRRSTVEVLARFIDPNGDMLDEIRTEAPSSVGTVVMGLDYEARTDIGNTWQTGPYRVEISIDGELAETLFFRVD